MENERIAILLMDTQGSFDKKSPMPEHNKIFALSALLASFQIYNVSKDIKQDDLEHLALFTSFAELCHQKIKVEMGKLHFLVRDWENPHKFSFGLEGGEEHREIEFDSSKCIPEVCRVLEALQSSYEKFSCYLMPHPGLRIATDVNAKGKVSTMDELFAKHLKEYVPYVFSKVNIVPKTVNGKPIIVSELGNLINDYANLISAHDKGPAMSMFEVRPSIFRIKSKTDPSRGRPLVRVSEARGEGSKTKAKWPFLPLI